MATNRELIEQAEALGKRVGVTVNTQGLSSSSLTELVADLQRQADQHGGGNPGRPASREPNKPNDQPAAADTAAAEKNKQKPPFTVARGRSVIGARGVIDQGGEIRADDVGGEENLNRLVQKGTVVKT